MSASEQHGSNDHSDRRRGDRGGWRDREGRGPRGQRGGGPYRPRQEGSENRGSGRDESTRRDDDRRPYRSGDSRGERRGNTGDRPQRGGYSPRGDRDTRGAGPRDDSRGRSGYGAEGRRGGDQNRRDDRGPRDRDRRSGGVSRSGERGGGQGRFDGRREDRRGGGRGGFGDNRSGDRHEKERYDPRGGREESRPRFTAPDIDSDVTGRELDRSMRHELKALERSNAERVAQHLVMAGRYIDDDPAFALEHANAAVRKAGRIAVVREAAGVAAYAAGDYALALKELRTHRRISGSQQHLPLMVDSQRALGREDKAMEEATSAAAAELDAEGKAELAMVVSGMHADRGDHAAALAALEIPQLDRNRGFSYSPKLFRAYAEALRAVGRDDEALPWERQAVVAEAALGVGQFSDPEIVDLGDDLDEDDARRTVREAQQKHSAPRPTDADGSGADSSTGDSSAAESAPAENTEEDPARTTSDATTGRGRED